MSYWHYDDIEFEVFTIVQWSECKLKENMHCPFIE